MIYVLVRYLVKDYSTWKAAFDGSYNIRRNSGEKSFRVFRNPENPNDLTLFLEWDSLESAKRFMTSEWLQQARQQAGVLGQPEVHYLVDIATTVRRTAAD
ncbi:MAG TPA: hypothetical protein VEG30_05850 [Terriglobales bacterium]|nr:hypothetical protein [Terriglobales bacterium]